MVVEEVVVVVDAVSERAFGYSLISWILMTIIDM